MRFERYLSEERNPKWGYGITFVDIDETTFHTFAKIAVIKNGKTVRELDNQEFNTYVKQEGETFGFDEFRDADLFAKTSIPIEKTINMVKTMLKNIERNESGSKIIFLTARSDFDNKKVFLDTFEKHGINMKSSSIYVERTGNESTGTVAGNKKKVMLKYLTTGMYRRVRLVDDDMKNLDVLSEVEKEYGDEIERKVIEYYDLPIGGSLPPVQYFALHVNDSGTLRKVN